MTAPTRPEAIAPRAWAVLAVASATVVLIILDSGFVSLAFPEIEAEFATTDRSTLSWVSSGYFIALAALMLVAGALAERWGAKRVFLGGLVIYAIGALAMAVAVIPATVIVARLIQGAGAAALTPVSLALALQEFPVSRRSSAIAGWAVIGGSTGVVAPTVGAIIVDLGGWRAPFVLLVALLAVVAVVATKVLPQDAVSEQPSPIDLVSVPLALLAVGGPALALSKVRTWGVDDPRMLGAVVVSAIAGPLLISRSRRAAGSLIDLELFRLRTYAAGSVASVLTQVGFFAFFFTSPLFFTGVWQYSVLTAGFALALHQGTSAVSGIPLGRLAERLGADRVVGIGGVVTGLSFLWMVVFVGNKPNFAGAIVPAFVIGGVGAMANGAFSTSLALQDIPDSALARASSGYYVTRRLASGMGVVVGAALLGGAGRVADSTEGASEAIDATALGQFKVVWLFVSACYVLSGLAALASRDPP